MEKQKLEELRDSVPCAAVLEQAGFAIDVKESTRKALKYRRGAEIVIVIHGGRGWFDPLSDAKGDVFGLAEHLDGVTFVEALDRVANLVGVAATDAVWSRPGGRLVQSTSIPERWEIRRRPWQGSMTWHYLRTERCLPATIIQQAIYNDVLREGPYGSMWAAHVNEDGVVTGWEERGPGGCVRAAFILAPAAGGRRRQKRQFTSCPRVPVLFWSRLPTQIPRAKPSPAGFVTLPMRLAATGCNCSDRCEYRLDDRLPGRIDALAIEPIGVKSHAGSIAKSTVAFQRDF